MTRRTIVFPPPSDATEARSRAFRRAAASGLASTVKAGAQDYDRLRLLPRLIAIDPQDIEKGGSALNGLIRARLARALRAERSRGRAGHWTYDLNRHIALAQALAAETGRRPDAIVRRGQKTPPAETGGVA